MIRSDKSRVRVEGNTVLGSNILRGNNKQGSQSRKILEKRVLCRRVRAHALIPDLELELLAEERRVAEVIRGPDKFIISNLEFIFRKPFFMQITL